MRNSKGIAWLLMLLVGIWGAQALWQFLLNYGFYILAAIIGVAVVALAPDLVRQIRRAHGVRWHFLERWAQVRTPKFKAMRPTLPADIRYVTTSNLSGRSVPTPIPSLPSAKTERWHRAVAPVPSGPVQTTVPPKVAVGLWNVQWAAPSNRKGKFFTPRLRELDCDVLCITEGSPDILPANGHAIVCEADCGYGNEMSKRKVMLWSRNPWFDVDAVGSVSLPPGRFIAGTTETAFGPIRFLGVCIPWRDAHVSSGQRNRTPWEDHLTYCRHLPEAYSRTTPAGSVLLGDFNQRVPRKRQPVHVYTALQNALGDRFRLTTAGEIPGAPGQSIDHLAAAGSLQVDGISYLSPDDEFGKPMSDHFGLKVVLTHTGT